MKQSNRMYNGPVPQMRQGQPRPAMQTAQAFSRPTPGGIGQMMGQHLKSPAMPSYNAGQGLGQQRPQSYMPAQMPQRQSPMLDGQMRSFSKLRRPQMQAPAMGQINPAQGGGNRLMGGNPDFQKQLQEMTIALRGR